jgi:hypothetical protein
VSPKAVRAAVVANAAWWLALFLLCVCARAAHADFIKETDGIHWWPGRGRIGPERCGTADTRPSGHADGTWAYFFDAQPTCPMTCDGTKTTNGTGPGAFCVHEAGVWDCCHGGGAGTCPASTCPDTEVVVGLNADCSPICVGTCEPTGGICTPDPAVPLEQRALRTVATSGTCQDNWLPYCDVRNYGAVGDGMTDDSAAIAAAITACCHEGTALAPVFFPGNHTYLVHQGFNLDESCDGLQFLGSEPAGGTDPPTIHLDTQLGGCAPVGSARPCTPLVDLNFGTIENMSLLGPASTLVITPGTDNANTDAIWGASSAHRVKVVGFTTAFNFSSELDRVNVSACYIGADRPDTVRLSVFQNLAFAALHFGPAITTNFNSTLSGYNEAPYLWFGEPTSAQYYRFTSDHDFFGQFGNAGLSFAGTVQGDFLLRGGMHDANVSPFVQGDGIGPQSNTFKLGAVAVDGALHFGKLWGRNVLIGNLTNTKGCTIDELHGTLRWIDQEPQAGHDPDVFPSATRPVCTVSSGEPGRVVLCDESETQCVPQTLRTLTASTPATTEESGVYRIDAAASPLQTLAPAGASCANLAGLSAVLLFEGTVTVSHHATGDGCDFALAGAADFHAVCGDALTLVHDGFRWRETARQVGAACSTTTTTTTTTTSTAASTTTTTGASTTSTTASTTTSTTAGTTTTTTTTTTTLGTTTTTTLGPLACTVLTHDKSSVSGTVFTTASVAPPSNHLILIATGTTAAPSSAPGAPTIAGNGLTWGEFGGALRANTPNGYRIDVHHALGASPTTGAITITFGSTVTNASWSVLECSPVPTSSFIAQAVSDATAATSLTVTLGAFGNVNNGTFGAFLTDRNCSTVAGSGFTSLSEDCIAGTLALDATDLFVEFRSDNDTTVDASFPEARNAMGVAMEIVHQ